MPSDHWIEVFEPYITNVDGSPEVVGFLTELSRSFDGSDCANHLEPCQLDDLRVSLICMKDECAIDESQQSVLGNLLQDARTFQARMQYKEARTRFERARSQAPSLLPCWKSTSDDGINLTSPLGYVLEGCDKVISNGLNAEGTPQERAQAHLDFLNQKIRDESHIPWSDDPEDGKNSLNSDQQDLLTEIQSRITKLCDATANLYEAENRGQLAGDSNAGQD